MNRTKAKDEAYGCKRTWGELKALVDNASPLGMSKVNKSLTKQQVIDIMDKLLDGKNLDETPETTRYLPHKNRMTLTSEGMGVMNILREFG